MLSYMFDFTECHKGHYFSEILLRCIFMVFCFKYQPLQEEIRFMINPELIAGMLFLPRMEDNEAIEIVGAERFSNYRG